MRSRLAITLVLAMTASVFAVTASSERASATGDLTREDVDAALARRRQASASLEAMTARFEQAMADEEILRERIADLARSVAALEQDIGERRIAVLDLVRRRYMAGGSLGTERLFTARTFTDIPIQSEYLDLLNARDLTTLRGLEAAEALHVEQQELLDASLGGQELLVAELTSLASELGSALADADAEYTAIATAYQVQEEERKRAEEQRRKEEEARRAAEAAAATSTTTTTPVSSTSTTTTTTETTTTTTTTETTTTTIPSPPPPVVTDGRTCPVDAATAFSDTWGAARSGGRVHKGVDMIASRNAPIVAVESGVVTRTSNSALGGLSIYLTGTSGSRYYYAHLEYIADGVSAGSDVDVGELLGGNGSSGNAPDWLPHLHFQYAPQGSDWIDPYPLVKALCG